MWYSRKYNCGLIVCIETLKGGRVFDLIVTKKKIYYVQISILIKIIFLSNSFLSLELLKYIGAFQKKCRLLPFIVWLGLLCNLEEKYLSFNVLVSNSICLKYLCVLTFLTYRFYFLLNLTILFFTYFFWNVWFDLFCQPCVPLNSVPFFSLSFVWVFSF